MTTNLTAVYLQALHPEDRLAVKHYAAPVFDAILYLAGRQTRDALQRVRAFGSAQS